MSEFYYKQFIQGIAKYDRNAPDRMNIPSADQAKALDKHHESIIYFKGKNIPSKALLHAKISLLLLEEFNTEGDLNLAHLDNGDREFYHILKAISKYIYTIACIDKTTDSVFIQRFAKKYKLFEISAIRRIKNKKMESYCDILNTLYCSIKNLKKESSLPFGFYLDKNAHEDWFPVPYLEFFKYLHQDHKKNKQNSISASWICHISHILTLLVEDNN